MRLGKQYSLTVTTGGLSSETQKPACLVEVGLGEPRGALTSYRDFVGNVLRDKIIQFTLYEPLIPSQLLRAELKVSESSRKVIEWARRACSDVIAGRDTRLIVVIGPCSIHDPAQALEYARLLLPLIPTLPDLIIVMRAVRLTFLSGACVQYFEKPRTTVGWKGLINDPDIDGTYKINKGLRLARKLLCDLTHIGLPVAVEVLDTISPHFLSELVSWGAIGARTTESQIHREVASGSPHPIGFKNGTNGDVEVAIEAMGAASAPHSFIGTNDHGLTSIVKAPGNPALMLILRGGKNGPNYLRENVTEARDALQKKRFGFPPSLMIDCSHGNCGSPSMQYSLARTQKDYRNQIRVIKDVCQQIQAGEKAIHGVMIESNIAAGRQNVPPEGREGLKYGVSITDGCIDFEATILALKDLQNSAAERRTAGRRQSILDEMYLRRASLAHDFQQYTTTALQVQQNPATQ
ncbi:3-deoxy-7-phosphoheptulonate synthase [Puccinia sorghi]|uniref:3-deoxy-7-phosphoheptulonate synthase n=1 Tax=Puccinia sorghi TaxID=27349 RepID=A0A0L6U5Y8_9BASI|nr:3-deoxy-7-phosphoheptulonate synthase [Puccinia sorghi]